MAGAVELVAGREVLAEQSLSGERHVAVDDRLAKTRGQRVVQRRARRR